MKTIFFVYFHELVNRLSTEETNLEFLLSTDNSKLYLSKEMQALLSDIQASSLFSLIL